MEVSRQQDSVQFPLHIQAICVYPSPGGQLALRWGPLRRPSPSSPGARSFLLPWVSLLKSRQKKGRGGGEVVGHRHLLPSVGLSLSQAQVLQEGLRRGGDWGQKDKFSSV